MQSKKEQKLKEHNEELKIQLAAKARELKIETGLEKVRAVAMKMKEPVDMLKVCKSISLQLQLLGIKEIRNVQTAIFYESKGTYMNFEYYAKHKKTIITDTTYSDNKIHKSFAQKMMRGNGEVFITHIKGKKVKDWIAYQKTTNVFIDRFLEKASSLSYYWHSLGAVALGISTYAPLCKDDLNLFNRFLNVFELAYTRHLDIEQAKAQAREAKIEASLEKVRAQSLGMRKPEDLPNVCEVLFNELQALGFPELRNAMVNIHNDENKIFVNYDYSDEIGKSITPLFYDIHPVIKKQIKKIRSADDAFSETVFKGKDLESWKAFRKSRGEKEDKRIKNSTALYYYFYSIGTGSIGISTFQAISAEKQEVLKRFRNVFAFAYRRYMDVAQAEAQAKEAKIELGLERVRARAMAMQHSDELAELVTIVFKELTQLDFTINSSIIWINNPETLTNTLWVTSAEMNRPAQPIQLAHFHHPFFHSIIHAWKEKDPKWIYLLTDKEKSNFEKSFFKGAPGLPQALRSALTVPEKVVFSATFNHFGALELIGTEPLSDEKFEILHRFGKVFDSSYTRFNDLKKAEAQARESQIQLALERVRARTMAMQHSDELREAANLLFQQVQALGIPVWTCGYNIWEIGENFCTGWMSTNGSIQPSFKIPLTESPTFIHINESRLKGEPFFVEEVSGEALGAHYNYMFSLSDFKEIAGEQLKDGFVLPSSQIHNVFNFKHGNLIFISGVPIPESWDIFKRFAKVFEQTYTRFLDLQKAEAQAREAKIELGLERVRARAMAMQKSDELSELVDTVFKELTKLDFALTWCIINIIDESSMSNTVWAANPDINKAPESYHMLFEDYPFHHAMMKGWKERKTKDVYVLEGEEKKVYDEYLFNETEFRRVPAVAQAASRAMDKYVVTFTFSNFGGLQTVGDVPLSDANLDILSRFGKVFDLTYTRFNDLLKAEAQARESQIEAALERVRSRSMGMQKSDELKEVIKIVYQQLRHLNIYLDHAGFVVDYTPGGNWHFWIADEQDIPSKITHPYFESVWANQFNEAKEKGTAFFLTDLNFEEKNNFYKELLSFIPGLPEASKEFYLSCPGLTGLTVLFDNVSLYIENFSGIPYSDDEIDLLIRFGKVFQQSYTRFLDLQKAEAQAREAKIEAALERTRTQSMIMQHSKELDDTLRVFHQQVLLLGIHSAFSFLWLPDEDKDRHIFWAAWAENNSTDFNSKAINYPLDRNEPATAQCLVDWKGKEPVVSYHVSPAGVESYFAAWQELIAGVEQLKPEYFSDGLYYVEAFMKYGCFGVMVKSELTEEEKKILYRCTIEFERAYTRFLDLQKAEAQAREAIVEASLERVRARTMAMHSSEDVSIATMTMFNELEKLNVQNLRGGILNIRPDETMEVWSINTLEDGKIVRAIGNFDMTLHPFWQQLFIAWKKKDEFFYFDMSGRVKEDYVRILDARRDYLPNGMPPLPDCHVQGYYFGEGFIWTFSLQPHPEDHKEVLKKFASVFSLTFRRYQDLKKAEAQTRQAQIETAMEKVRARALAMQKPDELVEVAQVLRKEMGLLGVEELETSSIYIQDEVSGKTECWYAIKNNKVEESKLVTDHMIIQLQDTWVGRQMLEFYKSDRKQISIPMQGDNRKEWIHYCIQHSKAIENFYGENIPDRTYHLNKFSNGYIGAASPGEISAESWDLLQRVTSVFSLAYTRFSDLQKSEANAKEAVKQAALDRVRAEIASMRTVSDLERITPLIWNELMILGVPFIRCGVFIMDEEQKLIHTFLSTPDGKAIAAFHLPYDTPGNFKEVVNHWHSRQLYIDHWGEPEFINMADTLVKQGAIEKKEQYLNTIPAGGFYLHFLPFLQGMLYVANTIPLGNEELPLIQSVADAFSTAYARYEDFNKLEAAKQQVDKTLVDLKQTQAQLVQSEKMASLGELTAGIAHEIQNPLNFVNNFSEVNSELISELVDEVDKGNTAEVKLIAADIKENSEKISHHGKRADAIVKGMLQHSSSGSGKKEPTDINALCDEYLRLAYHGLRAKDKSFNATMKTEFDKTIGNINIIPQDIGRVILNLITNAFYVVNEKSKQGIANYEPTVEVSTKKEGNKVLIAVKDNGNGISQKILDKIFQPFFTTKPTGQGTGLGLSLSYDIVKAHGGELKVETKVGEESEFIIQLPVV